MIKAYGSVRLADIEAARPGEWDFSGATHARVQLPSEPDHELEMQRRGFVFADRTLKASISLGRCKVEKVELEKLIRLPIVETPAYREDIFRIACSSFTADRRFHILPACDADIASLVLREWVDALGSVLVCLFRETPAGFLALRECGDALFVHLAAVEEKFRMSGAGMALYAKACKESKGRRHRSGGEAASVILTARKDRPRWLQEAGRAHQFAQHGSHEYVCRLRGCFYRAL